MQYENLFRPGKIGNLEVKNRIVMPPMGVMYGDGSGKITEREKAYFVERAKGGIGMVTSSCITVDKDLCGAMSPTEVSLVTDASHESIRDLINELHKYDTKFMAQLIHPGRQGNSMFNNGQQPVAPSAMQEADFLEMPRELTIDEIKKIIDEFIKAAQTSYKLGADGVELHGAHGYLIYQFMSHRANHRNDEYGGTFEKRMRFVKEIVEGINAIKPKNGILCVRINGTDHLPDGLTVEDAAEIALYLEKIGVDALSISNGTYSSQATVAEPAFYEEGLRSYFIKPIKEKLNIPVIAANNIKRPETGDQMIQDGVMDFIALGRPSLAEPHFSRKAFDDEDTIRTCISCGNCLFTLFEGGLTCSMNPYTGKEFSHNEVTIQKNGDGRTILVIGGGPGGIEAAITAAKRGFDVILYDNNDQLGGALRLASKGKGKEKVTWALNGMINELHSYGVKVVSNTTIKNASEITSQDPYAVVIAVGGVPVKPPITGVEKKHVYLAHDILKNDIRFTDKKIAVIGSGMTGLETAEVLIGEGNKIIMYDMLDEIAKTAEPGNKFAAMSYLAENGVEFKTEHKLKEIKGDSVIFENLATGKGISDDADVVVLSLGVKPNKTIEEMLKGKIENVISIGDCDEGTKICHATRDGMEKVWSL